MKCKECGARIDKGARACPECRTRIQTTRGKYVKERKNTHRSIWILSAMLVILSITVALFPFFGEESTPQEVYTVIVEIDDAAGEENLIDIESQLVKLCGDNDTIFIPSKSTLKNARYFIVPGIGLDDGTYLSVQIRPIFGVSSIVVVQDIFTEQDFWERYPYRIMQINIPCEELRIEQSEIILTEPDQQIDLSIICSPRDTTDVILFKILDESIATADVNGRVTAIGEGETIVEITCGTVRSQVPVRVSYPEIESEIQISIPPEEELFGQEDYLKVNDGDNLFAVLPSHFTYSSGAGGWCTNLSIHEDGSFEGSYSDSDLGEIGDGYPNGTKYVCDFTGSFSTPQKISDSIYSIEVRTINYSRKPGISWIEDGIRYIQSEPAGFSGVTKFNIFLPGVSMDLFSKEQLSYVSLNTGITQLPQGMFALYAANKESLLGFWGTDEKCLRDLKYQYLYDNNCSELLPYSYTHKSTLAFWKEDRASALILEFEWSNEAQREFTAVDRESGDIYDLQIYLKKDMKSVYVVLKSKDGYSMEPWGGTANGSLAATYILLPNDM